MGQLVNNTSFHENQLEAEREIIYRNIINQHRDMMELTLENIHYTSFRDHQLGQPTLGVRENAATLNLNQIKEFIAQHHTGGNLIVTATGDVNHSQLVESANKSFGGLQRTTVELPNSHQAYYTPSLMFMADDELSNLNVAAFLKAPAYAHPDSTLMRIIVELLGEYQADKHTATNLNDSSLQYNSFHSHLGDMTDIALHKCFYFAYSDAGLLGSYLLGNEVFGSSMIFASQNYLTRYSHGVADALLDKPS
jgi:processing peptidase subunit beta